MPTYDSSFDNSPITRVSLVNAAGQPVVGGSSDITSVTPGTTATSLGKAEDAVASDGDVGVMVLATRKNAAADLVSADGDYASLQIDSAGKLWVNVGTALPAGTNAIGKLAANSGVDIGDVDVTSVVPGTAATNLGKAVDGVAGATDTGVASLFVRRDTPATLTPADGDYARAGLDSLGSQWVRESYVPVAEDNVNGKVVVEHRYTPTSVTADTQIKAGAGFVHTISFGETDAAPTAGTIIVYDNTAESGTILWTETFTTTPFRGYTITIDGSFSTGLYVGFTTTADVAVTASYR